MTFKEWLKPFGCETRVRVYLETDSCEGLREVGIKSAIDWDDRYGDNEVTYANIRYDAFKGVMLNVILKQ